MHPAYRGPPGKASSSFYDHNGQMRGTNPAPFGQPHPNGQASYYHPHPQQQQGFHGGMYYAQPPMGRGGEYIGHQAAHSYDMRGGKRGYEELNDFFGSVKRRQVDPTSYAQVGRSLMPIHTHMGIQAGGGVATAEYMAQAPHTLGVAAASHGPLTQHYYLPPMPNLRTKEDLTHVDAILEQMQATVYENTGSPNTQYAVNMRHQSPQYATRPAIDAYQAVTTAQVASPLSAPSHSTGTPAVTPPSSSMSYTSGHSPTASSSGMSPSSRHSSTSAVSYPSLPNRPGLPYPSGLGSNFTHNERRLSGGVLQSTSRRSGEESESRSVTPKAEPGVVGSPSDGSEPGEAESYDDWVQHMRVIECLRSGIRARLERHEYEESPSPPDTSRIDPMVLGESDRQRTQAQSPQIKSEPGPAERPLYPVLPRIS